MQASLAQHVMTLLERLLLRPVRPRGASATASGLPRGWVGARLEAWLETPGPHARLVLRGRHTAIGDDRRVLVLEVRVDGRLVGQCRVPDFGPFEARFELRSGRLTPMSVVLSSAPALVPDTILGNGDQRELTFELDDLRLERVFTSV